MIQEISSNLWLDLSLIQALRLYGDEQAYLGDDGYMIYIGQERSITKDQYHLIARALRQKNPQVAPYKEPTVTMQCRCPTGNHNHRQVPLAADFHYPDYRMNSEDAAAIKLEHGPI